MALPGAASTRGAGALSCAFRLLSCGYCTRTPFVQCALSLFVRTLFADFLYLRIAIHARLLCTFPPPLMYPCGIDNNDLYRTGHIVVLAPVVAYRPSEFSLFRLVIHRVSIEAKFGATVLLL